jgi:hypothetical protein
MFEEGQYLYKISMSTKKVQIWYAVTDGANVLVSYGQEGGKITEKSYEAESKNTGKANETTAEEQAKVELQAKYRAQRDNKHYSESLEDAKFKADNNKVPQKIGNYKDYFDSMGKDLFSSLKLDGSRACIVESKLYSKTGLEEEIKVEHIKKAVEFLTSHDGCRNLDCEVYAEGLSLQRIRSAWTKPVKTEKEVAKIAKEWAEANNGEALPYDPNEDASKLKLYVFDIPDTTRMPFIDRVEEMKSIKVFVENSCVCDVIKFLIPWKTDSHEQRMTQLDKYCAEGYEGLVHYEPYGTYRFGERNMLVAKSKPRYDAEAQVLSVKKDKSGEGVLTCQMSDDMGSKTFSCKMKVERRDGLKYPRDYDTMCKLIGSWITYSYESISEKGGKPLKPVGESVRICDESGEALE